MRKRVVHIVDLLNRRNYGIIEAALSTSDILAKTYGIDSEIWHPTSHADQECNLRSVKQVKVTSFSKEECLRLASHSQLNPENAIIMSHGCWRFPTRFGYWLHLEKKLPWISSPHGMLEPWSLRQKWLKKKIYFHLFEHRFLLQANLILATSSPERKNLENLFPHISFLPNGIECLSSSAQDTSERDKEKKRLLFMGRLHHKKGILPLVKAWIESKLHNHPNFELIIVGFDDGELPTLQELLKHNPGNIKRLDPVYGSEKKHLFDSCHYFILPSQSEGAPMALLDAASSGLVPIITEACNLPEAFSIGAALQISHQEPDIIARLDQLLEISHQEFSQMSQTISDWVRENYSLETIAKQQVDQFGSLFGKA